MQCYIHYMPECILSSNILFVIDQPIWQKQLNLMYLNMFKTSFGAAKTALKCMFIHVLEQGIFLPLFVNLT